VTSVRLPLTFDPGRLRADLEAVDADEWAAHFNASYYDGEWSGVALRAIEGAARGLYPDPTASGHFVDTPVLARMPYVQIVLTAFECPLDSVRLLKLTAGSSIQEHRDFELNHEHGQVRVHIPIVTNDDVAFFLDGELVPMRIGEAWYLDLELRHRVDNRSDEDRIHLVIDCVANVWLGRLLASAVEPELVRTTATRTETVLLRNEHAKFADGATQRIVAFIRDIGLTVAAGTLDEPGAVPGIRIEHGALVVDESQLRFPGDLLHEAGHLAVAEPARRPTMNGDAASDGGEEMASIAWSYAAAIHLGIDPAVVFHSDGYRGGSAAILDNFTQGRYFGVPLLQWFGMTYEPNHAEKHPGEPFPAMRRWIRPEAFKID